MGYQNGGEAEGRNEVGLLDKLPTSYIWVTIVSSLALFLRTLFRLAETADGELFLLLLFPSFDDQRCMKMRRLDVLIDSFFCELGVFGFASTTEAYFGVLEYAPVIVGIGLWAAFPLYRMLKTRD